MLLAYLPLRLLALGRFGGYDAAAFDAGAAAQGLGTITLDLLVPLRWIGLPNAGTTGAGDLFLSGTVAAELGGGGRAVGLYLGSALASAHVGRLGNDPLPAIELQEFLDGRPELNT